MMINRTLNVTLIALRESVAVTIIDPAYFGGHDLVEHVIDGFKHRSAGSEVRG